MTKSIKAKPQAAQTNKEKPCHPHIAGPPFQIPQLSGAIVIGSPRLCCWHGEWSILYVGIEEQGCGPYVVYNPQKVTPLVVSGQMPKPQGQNN